MINWPADIISDLARRRTVLFLGSGVSRHSGTAAGRYPKTWVEFLDHLYEIVPEPKRHIRKLIKERDYLTACEILRDRIGRDDFYAAMREEYSTPQYAAARIHDLIFKLDSRIVATPNFDKIYESFANAKAMGSIVVKHHYDPDIAQAIRGTERVILKVHGTIDSLDRIIFTRKEYAEARALYGDFYALLGALSLTHTFLFLGCGVYDPDIRLLLEDTFFRHPSSRPHIFVLPNGVLHSSVRAVIQRTMNLKMLTYSTAAAHKELVDSLESLVVMVDNARDELAGNVNW